MSESIDPKTQEGKFFRFFTSIWIVPLIALIIALWLAWQHYSRIGPTITIVFPKNEGLIAGQSVVKYKDVPVGKVTKIEIAEEGEGVIVHAQMNKEIESFLNDESKFWIVKPEVSVTGVSGLETLLSGTYINMHAKSQGFNKKHFYGLTHAYRNIGEGTYFHLQAPQAYNVVKGTPIYFKNIKVGQVEYVTVSLDGKTVDFIIFVDQLYAPYIHTDSKFWVMSALDIDFSSGRLDVNVAPIGHLVHSGIAFSSTGEDANDTVPDDHVFYLYKNKTLANEKKIGKGGRHTKTYRIRVHDSVAKLSAGSAVRYQGFEVGRVRDIVVEYNRTTHQMSALITADIDISSFSDTQHDGQENFKRAIKEGLTAQLTPRDPLTGILFVNLVFADRNDTAPANVDISKEIPSIPMQSDNLLKKTERFVDTLNGLPLRQLLDNVDKMIKQADSLIHDSSEPLVESLKNLRSALAGFDALIKQKSVQKIGDKTVQTLKAIDAAMIETRRVLKGYRSDSPMAARLSDTLKQIEQAAQETKRFLQMLNRKPNALIFGDQ